MDWLASGIVFVIGILAVSVLVVVGVIAWSDVKLDRTRATHEETIRAMFEREGQQMKERTDADVGRLEAETKERQARDSVEVANELLREAKRKDKPS